MNNDRELLELAAKAAGIENYEHADWFDQAALKVPRKPRGEFENPYYFWKPLGDDGDALRLAVKLGMNFYTGYKKISAEILSDSDEPSIFITIHHATGDDLAATRRAIVRAAAEIGRTMK